MPITFCEPRKLLGRLTNNRQFALEPVRFIAIKNEHAKFSMSATISDDTANSLLFHQDIVSPNDDSFLRQWGIDIESVRRQEEPSRFRTHWELLFPQACQILGRYLDLWRLPPNHYSTQTSCFD